MTSRTRATEPTRFLQRLPASNLARILSSLRTRSPFASFLTSFSILTTGATITLLRYIIKPMNKRIAGPEASIDAIVERRASSCMYKFASSE